jgi:flagellar hook assembly protein FlgD
MNIKKLSFSLLLTSFCLSAAPTNTVNANQTENLSNVSINSIFDHTEFIQNELIIRLSNNLSSKEKLKFLSLYKLIKMKSLGKGFYVISFSNKTNISALASKLSQNGLVETVEPNYLIKKEYTPKEPFYKNQWFHKMINTEKAWDTTKGSNNVIVAVIDGGVHTNHPELKSKIYKPFDVIDGDTTLYPDDHATHVAGIIAASLNQVGVAGIAPNVKIMPINVFSGALTTAEEVSAAITYAADNGASVINLSLGSYYYSHIIENAINYAQSKGIIVIAAAGNDNIDKKTYPAAYNGVLGISATNEFDKSAFFSNYGTYVDFAAPGEDIYSTIAYGRYGYMSGTSMAAPVATGTVALMMSKNPFLSNLEVSQILKKSTRDLYQVGWDDSTGFGRIDVSKSIENTPSALSNITLSSKAFTMNGSNKLSATFKAHKNTFVTVFIKDGTGKIIRTLNKNLKSTGSQMEVVWNGKNDQGIYVNSGNYKMIVKTEKEVKKFAKETTFSVANHVKPSLTLENTVINFSPKILKSTAIKFKLNKYQKVSAKIYNKKGLVVHTLINNKGYSGGSRSLTWNGKDNKGRLVTDGDYKIKFEIIDSSNRKGESKSVTVKVDSKEPLLKSYTTSPTAFKIGKSSISVKVASNETSLFNIYIMNSNNQNIRYLTKNKSLKSGTHIVSWDGKSDSKKYVSAGKYKFVIEGKDTAGNKSKVTSNWFSVQK